MIVVAMLMMLDFKIFSKYVKKMLDFFKRRSILLEFGEHLTNSKNKITLNIQSTKINFSKYPDFSMSFQIISKF